MLDIDCQCGKKGCQSKATRKVSRGKRKPTYYCDIHYSEYNKSKVEKDRLRIKNLKENNPEEYRKKLDATLAKNRAWYQRTKDIRNQKRRQKFSNPVLRAKRDAQRKAWYQANQPIVIAKTVARRKKKSELAYKKMTYILQQINPNVQNRFVCEQVGRMIFYQDCKSIGLQIDNEFPLIDPNSPRTRTGVDLVLPELKLVIEAKASEATYTYKETIEQLNGYESLIKEMVRLQIFPYSGKFDFINYGIDGSNADMNMKELYETILTRTRRFLKKGIKFKFLKIKKMEKLFNQRIQQLSKAEFCFKNSAYYDEASVQAL